MADVKLSVNDLMQFLPDFRESLNIREIAFSLLAKSVIRLDQCASLTNGPASEEKVERLVKLLQALEMSASKPSGVYHFITSLRETGENNNIKGHVDLLSKILSTSPMLNAESGEEVYDDVGAKSNKLVPPPPPPPPSVQMPRQTIPISRPLPSTPPLSSKPPAEPPSAFEEEQVYDVRDIDSSAPSEDVYHCAHAKPAKSKKYGTNLPSAPPPVPPPNNPTKVDSDEDGYESWPGAVATDPSNDDIGDKLYEDFPTPKKEDIYEATDDLVGNKPSLPKQSSSGSSTEEEEDPYQDITNLTSDHQKESFQPSTEKEEEYSSTKEEEDSSTEEEEDQYQDITNLTSDHQKESFQPSTEDKQNTTASNDFEPEDYLSTDNESAHSKFDYIHRGDNEHDSIAKTPEAQKSHLIKAHELEMKDLDLKCKSEMKQLQLKQEEESINMKVKIIKLESENSKLAEHLKKSCKREEMFDQVVTLLQDTVSNLQTEMNELLATLESTKEKLKKYEATAT